MNGSWLVRWSVASARLMHRSMTALRALHAGFWLGILSDTQVEEATERFYATEALYLDEDYNRRGLSDWEAERVLAAAPPPARVLVPAAGAGRELIGLAELGYEAVGYDPSPDLVDRGTAYLAAGGVAGTLVRSPDPGVPSDVGTGFRVVLFGWGGISHLRGSDQRVRVFTELADLLESGGTMIVSFLPRQAGALRYVLAHRVATSLRRLLGRSSVELGDWMDGSFDHYFTFDEISAELAAAGLAEAARHTSPFAHVVATKP